MGLAHLCGLGDRGWEEPSWKEGVPMREPVPHSIQGLDQPPSHLPVGGSGSSPLLLGNFPHCFYDIICECILAPTRLELLKKEVDILARTSYGTVMGNAGSLRGPGPRAQELFRNLQRCEG